MVSHASIYMIGDILRHSVSIIMLPIYTRYLTPEDYGTVELLSMLIDVATIVFGAMIVQAVFRYYCTATTEQYKKSVISSALTLGIFFNGLGTIAIILFSELLSIAIFSDPSYKDYIALFGITMFLLPLYQVPMTYIRAQQKPWLFLTFSILKLVTQLSLNLYLVIYLSMHVEGVIYSAVISGAIMGVILLAYTIPKVGLTVRLSTCKQLFSFGLPLKFATLSTFYLTFGDRYFLNIFTDLSQVGIYALGYKFGFIFTLLAWTPFEKVWDVEKYLIKEKPDAKATYQKTFLYMSLFLIFIGLCISLFTKDLLKIMSAPAFHSAHTIVPIIIFAYLMQAWTKFCDLGILLEKKTIQIAYAETLAALVITVAYLTLIPAYGIYGAAWATAIGFIARFYWTNKKSKQYYDMKLPWNKVIPTLMIAAAIFLLSVFIPEDILLSIIFRTVLIVFFMVIVFLSPILSKADKSMFLGKASHIKDALMSTFKSR